MRRPIIVLPLLFLCPFLASSAGHVSVSAQVPTADAQTTPPAIQSLDVVVIDRDGRVPDDLGPGDFTVTVDGAPRKVLWVRHVSRGPGSESDAAERQEARPGTITYAAEPVRTVLVLVDQSTMRRGSERATMTAVNAFVDRLGLDDRLGVLRLPLAPDTLIELSTDRPSAREVVRQVASQAMPSTGSDVEDLFARQQTDPSRAAAVDPDRAGDPDRVVPPEQERPPTTPDMPNQADLDLAMRTTGLASLRDLLGALQKTPGRKVIALFSAGVFGANATDVQRTAAAAAASRATVYVFGLEGARGPNGQTPDTSPLEAVATATGGRFAKLDKKPDRTVDAIVPELAACYVLGVEAGPADAGAADRARPVRVTVARRTLAVHSAAWLASTDDPPDIVPASLRASPVVAVTPVDPMAPPPKVDDASAAKRAAEEAAREADLRHALARMTAYVEAYVREYSALVAEEDYYQSAGTGSQRQTARLKSDVLLVRPGDAKEWMCFRDIFEVNGRVQRDREDRLKRLFLDPSLKAVAQLQAIKDESARLNIGPVIRNLNVPLYPLVVLERGNLPRFRFKLAKKQESDGVERWRVEFEELIRPTLVTTTNDEDVPITGSFVIDPMTGAIVESRLVADIPRGHAELETRYRRDPDLGFWVPAEMTEFYRSRTYVTLADGRATYSNFRRFQVKTEQTVTVPK